MFKIAFAQYLLNKCMDFDKSVCYHLHSEDLGLYKNISFFMNFEQSYCP